MVVEAKQNEIKDSLVQKKVNLRWHPTESFSLPTTKKTFGQWRASETRGTLDKKKMVKKTTKKQAG